MRSHPSERPRIYDEELGDHYFWECDFGEMTITLWAEGRDDEWTPETFPLRRSQSRWQHYENQAQWERDVRIMKDNVDRDQPEVFASFPADVRASIEARSKLVRESYEEKKARGPSWIEFSDQVNDAISAAWKASGRTDVEST